MSYDRNKKKEFGKVTISPWRRSEAERSPVDY